MTLCVVQYSYYIFHKFKHELSAVGSIERRWPAAQWWMCRRWNRTTWNRHTVVRIYPPPLPPCMLTCAHIHTAHPSCYFVILACSLQLIAWRRDERLRIRTQTYVPARKMKWSAVHSFVYPPIWTENPRMNVPPQRNEVSDLSLCTKRCSAFSSWRLLLSDTYYLPVGMHYLEIYFAYIGYIHTQHIHEGGGGILTGHFGRANIAKRWTTAVVPGTSYIQCIREHGEKKWYLYSK